MAAFRLALCQINPTVGDVDGNTAKILAHLESARRAGAEMVVFPEMAVSGYPPEDLLIKPDFLDACMDRAGEIIRASTGLTVVFGCPWLDGDLVNAAIVAHDGRAAGLTAKRYLPNYGVFDENRYFAAGRGSAVYDRDGFVFGVSVCEDIWYPGGPPSEQAHGGGARLLVNISASPYHGGKGLGRERMLATRASDNGTFVAYANLVGGQDELVFDGHSLVFGPDGTLLARGRQFEEDLVVCDLDPGAPTRMRLLDPRSRKWEPQLESCPVRVDLPPLAAPARPPLPGCPVAPLCGSVEEAYRALVLATRDYVRKSGFSAVAMGLSGGIDSSLTAVIAADALGPENVMGVAMPTRFSSDDSLEDAEALAEKLGITLHVVAIENIFKAFLEALAPLFGDRPFDVAEENLQPRIRGTLLMALSNKLGRLVLTTGNKSEVGVGYSTLYGDTAGGYAVIKDVPKTLVYALSRWRNEQAGTDLIPERVLVKPPTAELRPNQKDSDSLPEYDVLDPVLKAYVELSLSPTAMAGAGMDPAVIDRVTKLVDRNEYKRRQSPPGPKITPRAFGKDWRLPIVNRYVPERAATPAGTKGA
ncbi:NAD+ synthetase [Solidesulfovibrio carbinoliphilus subsp. oakridgensis]|uniref:Glutamine-dependent NAD(+) synthetase n=1 Tax=Solidesulfovibrio carbinoliphilus subsp. oakridgensis TaxID=694327 RepID=G7Q6R9_9BACT|nr:NAD+ synthase [Solidesulfovibrio carbinoliphilus]EHJ48004.1 NAD+ synthetase [Solidesulfovibrio carbinoliphilus subsp. oakridgensis]